MAAAAAPAPDWDAWSVWGYAAAAAAACLLLLLSDWLKAVRVALQLTGPPALPLLGNVLDIADHVKLFRVGCEAYLSYGKVSRVWLSVFPMFLLLTPDDVQAVLSSQKHTEKIFIYRLMHNFLGQGLITSSGEVWHSHRKLLQPNFHIGILEQFVGRFHQGALALVAKLAAAPAAGFNVCPLVNGCVLDILNDVVLGIPVGEKREESDEDTPFRKGQLFVPYRITRPWLLFGWVYRLTEHAKKEIQQKNELVRFTRKALEARREKMAKASAAAAEDLQKRPCFLDMLISARDANKAFTDEDIVNEICTFMLAGQDSVGAAVAFALLLLAQHPQAQARVRAELRSVFGGSQRPPSRQDLSALRYLEQCVKETLRLYPSVPMVARRLGEDVSVGKHTLPKGAEVIISPFCIHRLSHVYPNPNAFDPDRFSPEQVEARHPYAFIPFSAGPRNCIGYKFALMELKTVLSTVLRNFEVCPVSGRDCVQLKYRLTLRSAGGVWLRLRPAPGPEHDPTPTPQPSS